jgi:hypothetical protein
MSELASLQVKVGTTGVKTATHELKTLTKQSNKTEKDNKGLARSFVPIAAIVGGATLALKGFNKALSSAKALGQFKGQLRTATGSIENANKAFKELQSIAALTPFTLDQSVDAFTRLVNMGLNPSKEAMISYGNTASAMGKDMSQMIEAVADAATFEFERLKEFGIKAKQEGDNVSFTFRGVTTTVKKNAGDIEKYLQDIGNNQFGDAMSNQMDAVGGKLSNLQDSWEQMWMSVVDGSFSSSVGGAIDYVSGLLQDLTNYIVSGAFGKEIESWQVAFAGLLPVIEQVKFGIVDLAGEMSNGDVTAENMGTKFIDAFKLIPVAFGGVVELIGKGLAGIVLVSGNATGTMLKMFLETFKSIGRASIAMAQDTAEAIKYAASGGLAGSIGGTNVKSSAAASVSALRKIAEEGFIKNDVYMKSLANTYDEVTGRIDATADSIRKLRTEGEALYTSNNIPSDPFDLGQFRAEGGGGGAGGTPKKKKTKARATDPLIALRKKLMTETETIMDEYNTRRALILASTTASEAEKTELLLAIERDRQAQLLVIAQETEQQRKQMWSDSLSVAGDFFGGMADLAAVYGKKGAAIAKSAAIVQATIKMYEGATSAYASAAAIPGVGHILAPIAAAGALAAGAANIASIKSQPAFENGGIVGGNSYSGDNVQARVNSGEMILNSTQQSRLFKAADGGGSLGGGVTVNVHNAPGQTAEVRETKTDRGKEIDIIITKTKKSIASDVRQGRGEVPAAMETTWNLGRGRS